MKNFLDGFNSIFGIDFNPKKVFKIDSEKEAIAGYWKKVTQDINQKIKKPNQKK